MASLGTAKNPYFVAFGAYKNSPQTYVWGLPFFFCIHQLRAAGIGNLAGKSLHLADGYNGHPPGKLTTIAQVTGGFSSAVRRRCSIRSW